MGINSEKKYAKVTMKFLSVWWCLCGFIPYWFCFLPKFSLISTCYAYNQKCGGSLRKQLILFPFANLCECQTKWKMGELPTWDEPAQIWMKQPFAGSWRRKTPILPLKKKKSFLYDIIAKTHKNCKISTKNIYIHVPSWPIANILPFCIIICSFSIKIYMVYVIKCAR